MRGPEPVPVVSRRGLLVATGGLAGLAGVAGVAGLGPAAHSAGAGRDPDLMDAACANDWMSALYDVVWVEGPSPTNAARIYNYSALAMYEAVACVSTSLRSLGGQLTGLGRLPQLPPARVDTPAILCGAVSAVAAHLFANASAGSRQRLADTLTSQVAARRTAGVPLGVVDISVEHGRRVGRSLVAWMVSDGQAGTVGRSYVPPVGADKWRPTPPNFGIAIEPYWSEVRPMVLQSADEVVPLPHVPFSTEPGSPFWEQAMHTYQVEEATTAEQRAIALYWRDNPITSGLPSGHWMNLVGSVSRQHALTLSQTVEAYARAGVALHDAFLNCWTWKYRFNLLRPVSYVQAYIDPAWVTNVNTPQFPEYTSGHSVASRAVSTVLTDLLGDLPFVDTARAVPGQPSRSFDSFHQAADMAAMSRLYGGIHFLMGIENGKAQGDQIGALVINRLQTRS
jgi:hypothetical protein